MGYYLSLPLHTPKNLKIPKASVPTIITQLQHRGIAVGSLDAWILEHWNPPRPGWVYLGRTRMSRLDFLHQLASSRNRFVKVTLIPGETTVIFMDQLARRLGLDARRLMKAYTRLSPYPEGGILADSYNVPLRYDEGQVVNYLLNLSRKNFSRIATASGFAYEPSHWQTVLTVASIVQKEAANRHEMPRIAAVIYNRLGRRMRLQMDGTLNYGRYSHVRVTPRRIRDDNSSYNTYRHRGLPDAPVCNVSATALQAALHPAADDALYFFRNDQGTHDFFRTYKAHLKEVHKKRRELETEKRERNATHPSAESRSEKSDTGPSRKK